MSLIMLSTMALLFALTVMLTCWVAAWWLDRRKVYIRV